MIRISGIYYTLPKSQSWPSEHIFANIVFKLAGKCLSRNKNVYDVKKKQMNRWLLQYNKMDFERSLYFDATFIAIWVKLIYYQKRY